MKCFLTSLSIFCSTFFTHKNPQATFYKVAALVIFVVCVTLTASGCGHDSDSIIPQQVNPFVGTWQLVKFDGEAWSSNLTWIFNETKITTRFEGNTYSGTYSFDETQIPKTLDLHVVGATPNPNFAIYNFPSDSSLVIKFMDGASDRATNFNVEDGYDLEEFTKE